MKKLFVATLMLLGTVGAMAQHEVGTVTLQPKVGLNIANMTSINNSDPRLGVAAGAELEYQAGELLSISAGALYSQQGYKFSNSVAKSSFKADYINVPILANVYVAKGLAVKLGLQPGFKVSESGSAEAFGFKVDGKSDYMKSFDLAMPVGLSYEFNNIVLDGRYNWGLTKVADNSDSKHSVFQITLGYKFAL